MRLTHWILGAALALAGAPLAAHPHTDIDQQVALTIGADRVAVEVAIVPSIDAGSEIFDAIDIDRDGQISEVEADTFAESVLAATRLTINGVDRDVTLETTTIPEADMVRAGLGRISIRASTDVETLRPEELTLRFQIGFDAFAHDWFVQPYFEDGWAELHNLPKVERLPENAVQIGSR